MPARFITQPPYAITAKGTQRSMVTTRGSTDMEYRNSYINSIEQEPAQASSEAWDQDKARALLADLQAKAVPLFRQAVAEAIAMPSTDATAALIELQQLAWTNYAALGFRCMSDAFAAIVPRSDTLTLHAWSTQRLKIRGFDLLVKASPFALAAYCVHVEVMSVDRSPLPFTETGYQSLFVPFAALVDSSDLAAYVADLFPADPIQTSLF
ncbi:hypothetical protein AB7878_18280 [Rhodanobacter humi]|uniref:Uncharacterized protein n=1 Tax=Rhodanobacter humi TaxID=1888173 RepID=A0ABV4AVG3_9GAMM